MSLASEQIGSVHAAAAWNQFRGPLGTGVADGFVFSGKLDAVRDRLWKIPAGEGTSSPILREDGSVVFTSGRVDRLETTCVDPADGRILWVHSLTPRLNHRPHPYTGWAASTPVTDGTRVFSFFGTSGLVALDGAGRELWRWNMPDVTNRHGFSSSPILVSGLLVQSVECEENRSFLIAFDPSTGQVRWRKDRPLSGAGWSTPTVWSDGGQLQLVLLGRKRMDGYELPSGELRWWLTGLPDDPVTLPVPVGDRLVVSITGYGSQDEDGRPAYWKDIRHLDANGDGKIQKTELRPDVGWKGRAEIPDGTPENFFPARDDFGAADRDGDGAVTETEWDGAIQELLRTSPKNRILALKSGAHGDARDGILWQGAKGVSEMPSALVLRDRVYTVRDGGMLTCFRLSDGGIVYQERLEAPGHYIASPVAAQDAAGAWVFVVSGRGLLNWVPAGDAYRAAGRIDLEEPVGATPALDARRGRIYLRTQRHLLAFQARP